jgi:hypothetical protein
MATPPAPLCMWISGRCNHTAVSHKRCRASSSTAQNQIDGIPLSSDTSRMRTKVGEHQTAQGQYWFPRVSWPASSPLRTSNYEKLVSISNRDTYRAPQKDVHTTPYPPAHAEILSHVLPECICRQLHTARNLAPKAATGAPG